VFFFGGRDGAAERAHERINAERGGVASVGWLNPGFGDVEAMSRPETLDTINVAKPDFVVVSLGAAKGQDWIDRNQKRLAAPVVAHLGAVVDFTAGSIRRAPKWMSALGLEWLFRIAAEPALWRRYTGDFAHLLHILATRLPAQMTAQTPGGGPASVKTAFDPRGRVLILDGDLNASNLAVIRDAFRDAVAARTDVVLDLSGTSRVDRAFLGLVLVLEKLLRRQGLALRARGINRGVQALFTANMMNYAEPEALSGVSRRSARAG
jgi:N-acetylglucosaminyldiphosphoundecaprenol N-acetyl-beta-D-mannosaminyltransferase